MHTPANLRLFWKGNKIVPTSRLHDSGYFSRFVQRYMKSVDVDKLLTTLASESTPCVPRDAVEMLYRGNQLTRTKFFLYDDTDKKGMPVYYYTGFQWASTKYYRPVRDVPAVAAILEDFNSNMIFIDGDGNRSSTGFNHVIGTKYLSGEDAIGYHMDKTKSFASKSTIAILSLGHSREFHVRNETTGKVHIFVMSPGDLFVLGWETNKCYKHSLVPVSNEQRLNQKRVISLRMSLCFRNISQRETLSQRTKKIQASKKAKSRRLEIKAKKCRIKEKKCKLAHLV